MSQVFGPIDESNQLRRELFVFKYWNFKSCNSVEITSGCDIIKPAQVVMIDVKVMIVIYRLNKTVVVIYQHYLLV